MLCKQCEAKPIVRGIKTIRCRQCRKDTCINYAYAGWFCKDCSCNLGKCMACGKKIIDDTNKPKIITFSGKSCHGKDTSADILTKFLQEAGLRVLRINMADFLKHIARQYLGWDGNKDEPGRTLLQQLGTEKVRHRFPDFWVDTVIKITKVLEDDFDYVLIGDCRFPNEISKWREEGYFVTTTLVRRPNFENDGLTEEQKQHPSETSVDGFKFDIILEAETMSGLEHSIKLEFGSILT